MTDTATYKFNHTMIRIKDPKVSLPFYEKNFGMKLIDTKDQPGLFLKHRKTTDE
jgi:lactoylglutathione lyase